MMPTLPKHRPRLIDVAADLVLQGGGGVELDLVAKSSHELQAHLAPVQVSIEVQEEGLDDEHAVEQVMQRVREALAQPVLYQRTELRCDGSVGMSRYPRDGNEVGDLIAAADRAMYDAKAGGRQRIRISGASGTDSAD